MTDVGSFEYWKIRPVLQRIESPEQLHQIELRSPQICGEDAELWRAFIARDIPNWRDKNYSPKNPLEWYRVYRKYKKEQQKDIERDEEILRNSMMGLKKERETHVSKVVDLRALPKIPKDPRMLANNGGVPIGKARGFKKEGASTLMWTAGSKTKLTDGKSVLTRARREAKEISQMSKLSRPTHQLKGKMGQVMRAPPGMVNEYQKASQPVLRILSRKHNPVGKFSGGITGISGPSLEEREARLRALTSPPKKDAGGLQETLVGFSEDDEDYLEDADDLFDEHPSSRPLASSSSPPRSSKPTPSRYISSSPACSARPPQATARPRPQASSASTPLTAARPAPKPSDLISSIISKPKPSASSAVLPRIHSGPPSRTGSPAPGAPRPMMPRKRAEVDIFNRGAKKQRTR
ncbi:RNA polymerase II transcription factor SIII subunit A-domain-containing protein [Hyaloscypha finlandica]|nr:RNA polymerase II transcription factor SIII subunit A-domain-containing protein [Hyaloscypha finlandica]